MILFYNYLFIKKYIEITSLAIIQIMILDIITKKYYVF